jgi:hypothetical protein
VVQELHCTKGGLSDLVGIVRHCRHAGLLLKLLRSDQLEAVRGTAEDPAAWPLALWPALEVAVRRGWGPAVHAYLSAAPTVLSVHFQRDTLKPFVQQITNLLDEALAELEREARADRDGPLAADAIVAEVCANLADALRKDGKASGATAAVTEDPESATLVLELCFVAVAVRSFTVARGLWSRTAFRGVGSGASATEQKASNAAQDSNALPRHLLCLAIFTAMSCKNLNSHIREPFSALCNTIDDVGLLQELVCLMTRHDCVRIEDLKRSLAVAPSAWNEIVACAQVRCQSAKNASHDQVPSGAFKFLFEELEAPLETWFRESVSARGTKELQALAESLHGTKLVPVHFAKDRWQPVNKEEIEKLAAAICRRADPKLIKDFAKSHPSACRELTHRRLEIMATAVQVVDRSPVTAEKLCKLVRNLDRLDIYDREGKLKAGRVGRDRDPANDDGKAGLSDNEEEEEAAPVAEVGSESDALLLAFEKCRRFESGAAADMPRYHSAKAIFAGMGLAAPGY